MSKINKFMNNILDANITTKKLANESSLDEEIKTLTTKEEISNKSRVKSRARWNSKTGNTWFKLFLG